MSESLEHLSRRMDYADARKKRLAIIAKVKALPIPSQADFNNLTDTMKSYHVNLAGFRIYQANENVVLINASRTKLIERRDLVENDTTFSEADRLQYKNEINASIPLKAVVE